MSFLSPVFLWALPLIAVPVAVHLFSRRRREIIRWGAMEFLLASVTPRRRFLRLKDLLLMLLRIAVVLAMVGALSQPMLSSGWLGSTGPRDVILVLDNSMSTARKLGSGTVFDHEMQEAFQLIQQLNASDVVRVLSTSPAPLWLNDTPVSADDGGKRTLMALLRQVTLKDGGADMPECLEEAIKADSSGGNMPRSITVVTDDQAYGWRANSTGTWSSIHALAVKALPPVSLAVVMAGAGSGPVANLAIEKLAASRSVAGVGQPVTLTASVKNTGTIPSQVTMLSWSADAQSLGISTVPALQPGEGATISLSQPFAMPGKFDVSCQLAAQDDLPPDDSAHFILEVTKAVPILLVQGEPRTDPLQMDVEFFLAALGYGEELKEATTATSVFQPKLISYEDLRSQELSSFRCVVLANIPRLPADIIQKLFRHVNSGGGLWIALGDQTDVDSFNRLFWAQSTGLSPLSLRQPVGDAGNREKFTAVAPPSADHPATALLADTQRLDMDKVRIYRRHQFDSETGAGVSVLLRAEGGAPLVIEKNLGRGRIIVQAFPLGLAWSNLALCHSYVVMVHEWLWYLTGPGAMKRNLQPGELLQAAQPIDSSNGSASLVTPAGRIVPLVAKEEDARLVFRYPKTLYSGEYRLSMSDPIRGSHTERFVVSRDTEESNLTPLSESEIQSLSRIGGIAFGSNPLFRAPSQRIAAPAKALAEWLLLALVSLMALEVIAAFWVGHRRRSATPAVVMEP
jgi:hypothetical protein